MALMLNRAMCRPGLWSGLAPLLTLEVLRPCPFLSEAPLPVPDQRCWQAVLLKLVWGLGMMCIMPTRTIENRRGQLLLHTGGVPPRCSASVGLLRINATATKRTAPQQVKGNYYLRPSLQQSRILISS